MATVDRCKHGAVLGACPQCVPASYEPYVSSPPASAGREEERETEWSEEYWQLDQAVMDAKHWPRPESQIARLEWLRDHIDELLASRSESARLRERYDRLREAVNESTTECAPSCDRHGHDGACPSGDPARWLEDQRAEIARLRELLGDCWLQWSYESDDGTRHDGGLSTLEDIRAELIAASVIDERGRFATTGARS